MRRFTFLLLVGVSVFIVVACNRTQPVPPPSPLRPTATIKDIMDSMVDPSADVLWESVGTVESEAGFEERGPKTDEEWTNVRINAIRIVEATNLLVMDGRHVAKPREKSENPGIELEPEEMEAMINKDRPAFVKLAHGLHDAASTALTAIDAKNTDGLLKAGEAIDTACENCHLNYWYPSEKADTAKAVVIIKDK